jgi:hypothetical protein
LSELDIPRVSRRTIVTTSTRLAYAAPLVAASAQLGDGTTAAQLISSGAGADSDSDSGGQNPGKKPIPRPTPKPKKGGKGQKPAKK